MSDRLTAHLRGWLGAWPPARRLQVVGSPERERPGWDGQVRAFVGVATPEGAVLSLPPELVAAVTALGEDITSRAYGAALAATLGRPGAVLGRGVYRWSERPADLPAAGEWLERDDPVVPAWLRPFNGPVLVARDNDAAYAAGVGVKHHDRHGWELAVATEERARGRGLARRLVAQAARETLDQGAVPTYLHDPANVASARVASSAGFPDRGWQVLGLFEPPAPAQTW